MPAIHCRDLIKRYVDVVAVAGLDLTVEALVLRPEYEELFSERERQIAASRLAGAGYQRPER